MVKSDQKRIAVILPRGEAIRNCVYSGALETLGREATVDVISVFPNEAIRALISGQVHTARPLEEIPERHCIESLRDLLDVAHNRYLWSEAAQTRWGRRDLLARRTLRRMLHRGLKKWLARPFAHPAGLRFLSRIERALSHALRSTDEYTHLFREIRPDLVFNASHVHGKPAIQAVQAAQWLGIPTATFLFSWDNLTSQGRIVPPYDYYLAWNRDIRRQLLRIYPDIREDQVTVTGTPQFDFHFREEFYWTREEFCRRVGADPDRPVIVYSTSMPFTTPGEERIVERIADLVTGLPEFGPPQLLVRVYGKDLTTRFDALKARRLPGVLFPATDWDPAFITPTVEDQFLFTNMLRHCAAGINVASTVSLELSMFDKPVINVAYDPPGMDIRPVSYSRYYRFDHYRPVAESGAVEVAYSEEALRDLLIAALREPARLARQRQALIRAMFEDTLDGRSATRLAETLLAIARNGNGKRDSH